MIPEPDPRKTVDLSHYGRVPTADEVQAAMLQRELELIVEDDEGE